MKADMKTQIRGYVSQIEDDQASIDSAEVLAMVEPVRELPRPTVPVPMHRPIVKRRFDSWVYGAVALAAVLLLVGGAAWIARSGRQAEPVVGLPTVTSTVPRFGVDDALPVAEAYFEAYNAGDADAVIALFTPDARFSGNFGPQDRTDWEQLLVWNASQGTALSTPDCRVVQVVGESVTVFCPHGNLDALVLAHEACPVPIDLTLTITPDGISDWVSFFGDPDFNTVGAPFLGWVLTHHPELADTLRFGSWTTREEAEQSGLLTAEYAVEWADWTDANGYSYRDSC